MGQQTHTTAQMASPTGRPGGRAERRNGVVVCMAKDAPTLVVVALQLERPPLRATATRVSQTGSRAGVWPRRRGAARMLVRDARQQWEGVLEWVDEHLGSWSVSDTGTCVAIFRYLRPLPRAPQSRSVFFLDRRPAVLGTDNATSLRWRVIAIFWCRAGLVQSPSHRGF